MHNVYATGPDYHWGHWYNTYLHYATSNKRTLWAEEGMTTSEYPDGKYGEDRYYKRPWEVRCVRILGIDMSEIITETNQHLTPAFIWSGESYNNDIVPKHIYPTYFKDETLRERTNSPIGPHSEISPLNRIAYEGFEMQNKAITLGDAISHGISQQEIENTMHLRIGGNQYNNGNGGTWNGGVYNFIYYTYTNNVDLADKAIHDSYVNGANRLCQQVYGSNWRLPTLKEAALMKAAWNDAGYHMGSDSEQAHESIRSYLTCTYREYGVDPQDSQGHTATFSRNGTGYYSGIVYDNTNSENTDRVNIATQPDSPYYIRCVRDLTPGEFPSTRQ